MLFRNQSFLRLLSLQCRESRLKSPPGFKQKKNHRRKERFPAQDGAALYQFNAGSCLNFLNLFFLFNLSFCRVNQFTEIKIPKNRITTIRTPRKTLAAFFWQERHTPPSLKLFAASMLSAALRVPHFLHDGHSSIARLSCSSCSACKRPFSALKSATI